MSGNFSVVDSFRNFFVTFVPWSNQSFKFYVKVLLVFGLGVFSFFIPESWFEMRFFGRVYTIVFAYLFLNLLFNYLRLVFVNVYLLRNDLPSTHYDNFIIGINKLSFFLNHVVFLVVLLTLIGVRVFEILTSLTVVAVALVLIFKDYIGNFMNGTIVMFSKKIQYNDYVKVGEFKGRIKDINFMFTELETESGDVVYIPNNSIVTKEILNFSRKNSKKFALEFALSKDLLGKLDGLEKEIFGFVGEKYGFGERDVSLVVERFDKDNVVFKLVFSTGKYSFKLEKSVRDDVNKIILRYVS